MQEPPTPMTSFRMGGKFQLGRMEDQSMLMDQQPIFGDESVMDMTFELGSESGLDGLLAMTDEDDTLDGIWGPQDLAEGPRAGRISMGLKVSGQIGDEPSDGEEDEDGDSTIEVARNTSIRTEMMDQRSIVSEADATVIYDPMLDFDTPPSPFNISRDIEIAHINNDESLDEGSLQKYELAARAEVSDSVEEERVGSGPGTVMESRKSDSANPPRQADGDERGMSLPYSIDRAEVISGSFPEEATFTARGERPTWSEEEERSRAGSSTGPGTGMGSSTSGSSKRPASSPRQAKEKKKSKVRSPNGDDYYTRRLSRSISSGSTIASPFIAAAVLSSSSIRRSSSRANSFSLDQPIHPSRTSEGGHSVFANPQQGMKQKSERDKSQNRMSSPALRASSPPRVDISSTPAQVPRPTLLARFLAKSSVLHPPSPAQDSPSASASKTAYSPIPELATFQEPVRTAATPDLGSSIGSSRRSVGSPEIARRDSSRRSRDKSIRPDDPDSSTDEVRQYSRRDSRASIRNLVDQESSVESGVLTTPPGLDESRSNHSQGADASLRRSTSQRVLGFFSDLLRSSTSSSKREEQDLAASASSSKTENPVLHEFIPSLDRSRLDEGCDNSYRSEKRNLDESESRGEYGAGVEGQSSRRNQSATTDDSSRLARLYPASSSIPALKYIPLTRPTKAFVSHTASRVANPIRQAKPTSSSQVKPNPRPAATSKFASAALARLPAPGKGSSSAGEKITVKPIERASNLQARRALFDRPTDLPSAGTGMKKTIPLTDKIPGKAMQARAEQRSRFDRGVQQRLEEKKRNREKEEKEKMEREEREYREKRKETVVKARPVPEMYKRKVV